ncbi:hypothetical protein [Synechocystis sp. PCC 7509]|uniref:hypothetical protein n=1 Tax=Synechocystis sp. PCC 7509 TaxID=927677 RepID=UPI0002ABC428|nr:hypothetical protein [Synechocystis sp. PCC 7509]
MSAWDLALRENWGLVLQDSRMAERIPTPNNPPGKYKYKAIPPIYATCDSSTVLIGTYSQTAETYWFLGAKVSQFLYVSPSLSSNFVSGVQAGETKNAGLNRLTLIKFEDYGVYPYTLKLEIPYWLEDIYMEVWQYTGYEEQGYEEVLDRLDSIEMKIDEIQNYDAQ